MMFITKSKVFYHCPSAERGCPTEGDYCEVRVVTLSVHGKPFDWLYKVIVTNVSIGNSNTDPLSPHSAETRIDKVDSFRRFEEAWEHYDRVVFWEYK